MQKTDTVKRVLTTIFFIHILLLEAVAQTDSIDISALKAEIKREVIAELKAEEEAASKYKQTSVSLYGFVRNYITYDSRQCIALSGELFNLMPKDEMFNAEGVDLNSGSELMFVAFTTRFGLDVAGPRILNAESSAKIEADFCGFSTNNLVFRIRHAYARLAWNRTSLLVGQTWHPTFQVTPTISGYTAGAPFASPSRFPQIRAEFDLGHGWSAMTAALFQFSDASYGPDGESYEYSRWGKIPEFYASLKHTKNGFTFGAGASVLSIMPRRTSTAWRSVVAEDGTMEEQPIEVRVNNRLVSIMAEVFADYKRDKFNIKGKVVYAENTSHMLMLSGFGATSYDRTTGEYEYASIRTLTTWLNATYGRRVVAGVLLGFTDNMGAKRDFISTDDFWMLGAKNADYIYRIAPSITYHAKNLEVALECERTVVGYGDLALNGRTKATRNVANQRIGLMMRYHF